MVESRVLMAAEMLRHDQRSPVSPAAGPLENYAARFDDLFGARAQRHGFRRYLEGLLLPAERNKTLTALANTEPVVGAQCKGAQSLQRFLSESRWDPEEINRRRVELLLEDSASAPNERGALVIDETVENASRARRPPTWAASTFRASAR